MARKARGKATPFEISFGGFPGFDNPAMRMGAYPLEAWLRWQAEVLQAAGPEATKWLARRREAVETALEALGDMVACKDLTAAAAIQRDWIEGEMARLQADMQAMGAQTFAWARRAAEASQRAAEAVEESESEVAEEPPARAAA